MSRLTWFGVLTLEVGLLVACYSRPSTGQETAAQEAAARAQPGTAAARREALGLRYRQMADELKAGAPASELKVVEVPQRTISLRGSDPKVLENKFVAEFTLAPAITDAEARKELSTTLAELMQRDLNALREYPAEILGLLHVRNQFLLHQLIRLRLSGLEPDRASAGEHFRRLAAVCPAEARPAEEPLGFLTSAEADRDVQFRSRSVDDSTQNTISVYAPTAEAAELRARAILRLYDRGLSPAMRTHLLAEGEQALGRVAATADELNGCQLKIAAEGPNLAKPSDISPEVLSQLKAQKVLVAVELAGLSARVQACDAKLSDPKKLDARTLQSIGEIKITAEIERVGVKEKLDQINAFVAEGEERNASRLRLADLQNQRNQLQATIRHLELEAGEYADLFALYAPFQVVDNQINVGPIEWSTE